MEDKSLKIMNIEKSISSENKQATLWSILSGTNLILAIDQLLKSKNSVGNTLLTFFFAGAFGLLLKDAIDHLIKKNEYEKELKKMRD